MTIPAKIFIVGDGLQAGALTQCLSLLSYVVKLSPSSESAWWKSLDDDREAVVILGLDEDVDEVWKQLARVRLKQRWMGRVVIVLWPDQKSRFDESAFIRQQDQKYPAHGFLSKPLRLGLLLKLVVALSPYRTHGFTTYLNAIASSSGFDEAQIAWKKLQTLSSQKRQQVEAGMTLGRLLLNMEDSVSNCLMTHSEKNVLTRWAGGERCRRHDWMVTLKNIITRM